MCSTYRAPPPCPSSEHACAQEQGGTLDKSPCGAGAGKPRQCTSPWGTFLPLGRTCPHRLVLPYKHTGGHRLVASSKSASCPRRPGSLTLGCSAGVTKGCSEFAPQMLTLLPPALVPHSFLEDLRLPQGHLSRQLPPLPFWILLCQPAANRKVCTPTPSTVSSQTQGSGAQGLLPRCPHFLRCEMAPWLC